MIARQSTASNQVQRFWDKYLKRLHQEGIKHPFDQWYVKRAEAFLRSSPRRLSERSARDVEEFFRSFGRKPALKDWQFRQIVDATRMLMEVARVAWRGEVDWNYWRDSARTLAKDHPTIARSMDQLPREAAARDDRSDKGSLADARNRHLELVTALRSAARRRGLAIRTEQSYEHWALRFLIFHGKTEPESLKPADIEAYLSFLALRRDVSASTQNIALNALVFLFREVLKQPDLAFGDFARARRPRRLPTVLDTSEVSAVLGCLEGTQRLMIGLMYGTGMRLMECCRLRVQDIDFACNQIMVRNAKGGKDRVVPLPARAIDRLREHLARVKTLHDEDLEQGVGEVYMPEALARKIPSAAKSWGWQYVFPSGKLSKDPRSGVLRRHHVHESGLQKAIKRAAAQAGLTKRVGTHTMRHSFATNLLQSGYDIRTVQELLGHADVSTTMIYTHVLNRGAKGVQSPLDALA